MKSRWYWWFVVAFGCVLLVSYQVFDAGRYFSLEAVQAGRAELEMFVDARPIISLLVFVVIYYLAVTLSLPFASVLSLTAGFLFGVIVGTLVVVVVATLGATTLFLVARGAVGMGLRERYRGSMDTIVSQLEDNAVSGLLFLRLVPLFPFFLVNLAPAFTNIKVRTFFFTTLFGIVPGSFAFVFAGKSLGNISEVSDVLSSETILALSLLGLVALAPSLWKWWLAHTNKKIKKTISYTSVEK